MTWYLATAHAWIALVGKELRRREGEGSRNMAPYGDGYGVWNYRVRLLRFLPQRRLMSPFGTEFQMSGKVSAAILLISDRRLG